MTSSGGAETAQRRVLVVEDRAHWPSGHFPTRFAELAEGFAENGCIVEVLTSQGWLHDGERPVPFVVNRYGRLDSVLYRAGEALRRTRGLQGVSSALRTLAVVRAARARCRKTGDPMPDVVIVSMGIDPFVGSAFARRGNWLFYEFGNPSRLLRRLAKRAARSEARRRLSGGRAHRNAERREPRTMGGDRAISRPGHAPAHRGSAMHSSSRRAAPPRSRRSRQGCTRLRRRAQRQGHRCCRSRVR